MGKVFVKGPVESPDDLLAKQTMAQRLKDFVTTRNIRGAGEKTADFAGNIVGSRYGAKDGGRFLGDLFSIPLALLGRRPKTPEEEEHARQMIRIAEQDRIREQMRPARETRAYRELQDRYGLSPQDVKQIYGKISPEDALNQEKIVQQGLGRERRRDVLRGQQGGERSQAEQTAGELEAAADAAELPRYDVDAAIAPRALNLDKEIIEQEAAKINAQLQPASKRYISNEEMTQLMEPEKPQLMPNVEAIRNDPLNTAPPADNATAQIKEVETAAQAEQQEHGMDHKAGMEPPKQEDEGEGGDGNKMRLMPQGAFGFGNQPEQTPAPAPGSVLAGPDALNDLNRQFGR